MTNKEGSLLITSRRGKSGMHSISVSRDTNPSSDHLDFGINVSDEEFKNPDQIPEREKNMILSAIFSLIYKKQ